MRATSLKYLFLQGILNVDLDIFLLFSSKVSQLKKKSGLVGQCDSRNY